MDRSSVAWTLILVAALGTFCLRFSFIALLEKISEPPWFRNALRYVPAAVMAALVSSSLLVQQGQLTLQLDNLRLWAALLAACVGYVTRSLLWTIASGLLALFTLNHLMG